MAPTNTGMKRFLPEFMDPEREAGFRLEFFNVWKTTARRTILLLSLCIVALAMFYFAVVLPRDYQYAPGILGDREALGEPLAHATMFTPLIIIPVTMATFTRFYSVRTHIKFIAVASLGTFLALGWPVHVADAM